MLLRVDSNALSYYHGGQAVDVLGIAPGGGAIQANDTQGRPRAVLGEVIGGGPGLALVNSHGVQAVQLYTKSDGSGFVSVAGHGAYVAELKDVNGQEELVLRNGNVILGGIGATSQGGLLQINDGAGKKRVSVSENGFGGAIGVYDQSEQRRAFMAMGARGGEFDVLYPNSETAAQLAQGAYGGLLQIANAGGTARAQAGVLPSDRGVVRVYGPGGFNYISGRG